MVLHVAKSSFSNEVEHISFPAEAEKVRYAVFGVEEFGGWAPAHIVGGDGAAKIPASYIERDALFSEEGVQKLNQLARLVDTMDLDAQKVFSGALMVEHAKCLDDVLRVAGSLDSYELFPGIKTDEELGHFLVDTGPITGKFVFAEEVQPYLDYAKIGAEQRKLLDGAHTEQGFVKRRENVQTQATEAHPAFALTLASPTGACRLNLPAPDDELERAKRALGLDDLGGAAIQDVEIGYPWAHLLPMDSVTLEDANILAECVREMTTEELKVFGAVLEVEEPRSFHETGTIAMDIDDYELVQSKMGPPPRPSEAVSVGRGGARERAQFSPQAETEHGGLCPDEEMLDGFTDFDALGRCEMEADGVRETSFGSVRRLSAPWPQQEPEIGQTMG